MITAVVMGGKVVGDIVGMFGWLLRRSRQRWMEGMFGHFWTAKWLICLFVLINFLESNCKLTSTPGVYAHFHFKSASPGFISFPLDLLRNRNSTKKSRRTIVRPPAHWRSEQSISTFLPQIVRPCSHNPLDSVRLRFHPIAGQTFAAVRIRIGPGCACNRRRAPGNVRYRKRPFPHGSDGFGCDPGHVLCHWTRNCASHRCLCENKTNQLNCCCIIQSSFIPLSPQQEKSRWILSIRNSVALVLNSSGFVYFSLICLRNSFLTLVRTTCSFWTAHQTDAVQAKPIVTQKNTYCENIWREKMDWEIEFIDWLTRKLTAPSRQGLSFKAPQQPKKPTKVITAPATIKTKKGVS